MRGQGRLVRILGCAVLGLSGCLSDGPPADVPAEIVLTDVSVDVGNGALQASLARAHLDPDGSGGAGEQVVATVEATPRLVVESARSDWDLRSGRVVFEGSVRATRGDVTLLCDHLEATLDGEVVRAVEARGAVRVEREDRIVTAAQASLDVKTGRLELTGSPVVQDGARRLLGRSVVVHLDDERLECADCRLELEDAAWP